MTAVPLPLHLRTLDHDRLRRYRQHLAFYEGDQWAGRARRGERRLVLNYARAFVDKITSYLFEGHSLQIHPRDRLDTAAAVRARAAEHAWRAIDSANGLSRLDFETELDCAVLGDAAYKVTWDVDERRVRISAPDVQGVYVWRRPDDSASIEAVASQYSAVEAPQPPASLPRTTTVSDHLVTEYWTDETFELWRGAALERREANPYGFIPFVVFPNVSEPKQPWGSSDVGALAEPNRELNRAFSQLSQIIELSGNPIAVLEGVAGSEDISVEPGAVWEVPERARAYLLDLLQGGGAALHRDYIDLVYRTLHDLGESPRTAFGQNPAGLSGVALNVELDPVARKVARKRLIRTAAYERRARMALRLLARYEGLPIEGLEAEAVWGPVLPADLSRQVADERSLVESGIRSRRTAAANLGDEDPEAEWRKVREEAGSGA